MVLGVVADQAGDEADAEADAEPEADPRGDRGAAQPGGEVRPRPGTSFTLPPRARRTSARGRSPRSHGPSARRRRRSRSTSSIADHRPAEGPAHVVAALAGSPSRWCAGVPGAASSTTTRPRGSSTSRSRRSRRDRVAADADVAVGEQRRLPASLAGQGVEDVAVQRRRRRVRGSGRRPRGRRRCRARRARARRAQAVSRPGPQPTSRVGPAQSASSDRSSVVGRVHPDRQRLPTLPSERGSPRVRARRSWRGPHRRAARQARANSPSGTSCGDRVGVGDGVDVAQGRGRSPTLEAVADERAPGVVVRRRRGHRHVVQRAGVASAARSASTHQPPSSAGPSTASWSDSRPRPRAAARR